jgi:hypothetical protein
MARTSGAVLSLALLICVATPTIAADPHPAFDARPQVTGVDPIQAPTKGQPAAADCFMGECFREFVASLATESAGLILVQTRIERYCGLPDQRQCAPLEQDMRTLPNQASYKVKCGKTGGYVEVADGNRVSEPEPNPPHATRSIRQLWWVVCAMGTKQGAEKRPSPGAQWQFAGMAATGQTGPGPAFRSPSAAAPRGPKEARRDSSRGCVAGAPICRRRKCSPPAGHAH